MIMQGKWFLSCLLMLFQRQLRTFEHCAQERRELEKQLYHHCIIVAQYFTRLWRDSWHRYYAILLIIWCQHLANMLLLGQFHICFYEGLYSQMVSFHVIFNYTICPFGFDFNLTMWLICFMWFRAATSRKTMVSDMVLCLALLVWRIDCGLINYWILCYYAITFCILPCFSADPLVWVNFVHMHVLSVRPNVTMILF